jgi:hypothetical protein
MWKDLPSRIPAASLLYRSLRKLGNEGRLELVVGCSLYSSKNQVTRACCRRYLHVVRLFLNGLQLAYLFDVSMRRRLSGKSTNRGPERTRYWHADA